MNNIIIAYTLVVRSWCARRVVAKLRDEAAVQSVAIETMMESIVTSDYWDKQYQLHKIDQMVADDQLQHVLTMMGQVDNTSTLVCIITQPYR